MSDDEIYQRARAIVGAELQAITYNEWLPAIFGRDPLRELYGSVDNIDLWVGLLAEDHVRGSTLGPTLERILIDQFTRLRNGDRYWYESVFSGRQLRKLDQTTLADIIRRNTEIDNLQDNVFIFEVRIQGTIFFDRNGDGRQYQRETGLSGFRVELLDEEGAVIATTRTSRGGHYRFANINEPGTFTMRVVPRFGAEVTTENPRK